MTESTGVKYYLGRYRTACLEVRRAARLMRQMRFIYYRVYAAEGAREIMEHIDEHLKATRARREWWLGELRLAITRTRARSKSATV